MVKFYVSKDDPGVSALELLIAERLKKTPKESSITLATPLHINLCEKVTTHASGLMRKVDFKVVEEIILPKDLVIKLYVKYCNTHGKSNGLRDKSRASVPQMSQTQVVDGQEQAEYFGLFIDFSTREVRKFAIPARSYARAS